MPYTTQSGNRVINGMPWLNTPLAGGLFHRLGIYQMVIVLACVLCTLLAIMEQVSKLKIDVDITTPARAFTLLYALSALIAGVAGVLLLKNAARLGTITSEEGWQFRAQRVRYWVIGIALGVGGLVLSLLVWLGLHYLAPASASTFWGLLAYNLPLCIAGVILLISVFGYMMRVTNLCEHAGSVVDEPDAFDGLAQSARALCRWWWIWLYGSLVLCLLALFAAVLYIMTKQPLIPQIGSAMAGCFLLFLLMYQARMVGLLYETGSTFLSLRRMFI